MLLHVIKAIFIVELLHEEGGLGLGGGGTCALLKKCVNFFNLFLKM